MRDKHKIVPMMMMPTRIDTQKGHIIYAAFVALYLLYLCTNAAHAQSGFQDPGAAGGNFAGGGDFIAVTPTVAGGGVTLGSVSQVIILFRNESGKPVNLGAINIYPSSNVSATVTMNQCSSDGTPVQPGVECAMVMSVKGLQAGAYRVEMLMRHDGLRGLVRVTVNGSVEASASGDESLSDIRATPNEVDFGSLDASQQQFQPIILRNATSTPIDIYSIEIRSAPSAGFSQDNNCTRLAAGQACVANVTWSPRVTGPASGSLLIEHSGPSGLTSISLNGEYDPEESEDAEIYPDAVPGQGLLVSSIDEIDFGSIEQTSRISVSLVNAGDAPLVLENIELTGADSGLNIMNRGCREGMTLQPIQACPLTLSWSPVRIGPILDDVQVFHNGTRGVLLLPVRGSASKVVSQESQPIILSDPAPSVYLDILEKDLGALSSQLPAPSKPSSSGTKKQDEPKPRPRQNLSKLLDGFAVTSLAKDRAVINGPGGSRVVFNRSPIVIGGVAWDVRVKPEGIEMSAEGNKVLLLFDRSLSSGTVNTGGGGGATTTTGDGG